MLSLGLITLASPISSDFGDTMVLFKKSLVHKISYNEVHFKKKIVKKFLSFFGFFYLPSPVNMENPFAEYPSLSAFPTPLSAKRMKMKKTKKENLKKLKLFERVSREKKNQYQI